MEKFSILIMFGMIVVIAIVGSFLAPRFPPLEKHRPDVLPGRSVEGRRAARRP